MAWSKRIWNLSALHFSNPKSNNHSAYKLIKREANFFALLTFWENPSQTNSPLKLHGKTIKSRTRRDAPKSLYTCLYDNLPIQYIWLNDWSNMSSSITLICSFRISHQILCTTFRKHSMNLILKLFVFGFRLVELYLQVEQKFAILGDFVLLVYEWY